MVTYNATNKNNLINNLENLDIKSFCELQSEQITSRDSLLFTRIVFYNSCKKEYQEVIKYANLQRNLIQQSLNYLRSEKWLIDYPVTFNIAEINFDNPHFFAYICPFSYRNKKPEYIQVLSTEPLSEELQKYLKNAARMLSKYIEVHIECELQKAEVKLLEQILQRASHQLRNSFSLISLYAQNLYFGLKDNPWQEQAEIIRDSIQKLDINLSEMIDCSQGNTLRLMPQDLRQIVDESIKGLQPLINQKKLKINLSDTSTILMLDSLQIKQVFDNLLSNAVYFSPISGSITCNWQTFQGEVLIKIADEGPGLSEEDLQKIFTPFYSRRQGGTGLGLTVAKKIILDHQGSLWAQNLGTGGAQFSLIIPRKIKV
ncbi:sensor histidine kinase [Pelatocladus sp. BLCC-F211]|uniref:sensor histidine kinase n=1 Tax=Pelatocladus sp. BLCC-F211 TaxID=3342752 RepID=UPI0035BAC3D3